jgi:hypothetical protein
MGKVNEPYANIKADAATVNFKVEDGKLRFKGGTMTETAVVSPNQYIEITNDGGSVTVRIRNKPALYTKGDIAEVLMYKEDLKAQVNALAKMFDVGE